MKQEPEKEYATCRYAGASMLEDPCATCIKMTMRLHNEVYPKWEPNEDPE